MTNEQNTNDIGAWLLSPLGAGEARIFFAAAEDAELTTEVRQALDALARALQEAGGDVDVEGFSDGCVCKYKKFSAPACNPLTLGLIGPEQGLTVGIPVLQPPPPVLDR
jgi:hypothetical protein